jgi:hypothetical protein
MKAHSAEVSEVAHSAGVVYRKVYSGVPVARLLWCQPRGFFFTCSRLFCLFLRRMARATSKLTRLVALRFAMRPAPALRLPDLIPSWPRVVRIWPLLTNSDTNCRTSARVRRFRAATCCSPLIHSLQHRFPSSNGCVARTLTLIRAVVHGVRRWAWYSDDLCPRRERVGPHAARPNSRKRTNGSLEGCKYWGVRPRGRPSSVGGFG